MTFQLIQIQCEWKYLDTLVGGVDVGSSIVITIIPCGAAFSEVFCYPQFYGNSKLNSFRNSPYKTYIALDVRLLL